MQYEIRRIQQQVGITTVFVTHDQEEALTMSDEILLMHNGRIEQLSTPKDIYNHPVSLYASDFLGKANTLIGALESRDDGWFVSGDGWSFPVCPQEGFTVGEQVYLAIRGEQVGISPEPTANSAACTIKNIVFTGEICLLMVDLKGTAMTVSCINVLADCFQIGQTVHISVDPNITHYFKIS